MDLTNATQPELQGDPKHGLPLSKKAPKSLLDRGDWWFFAGCLVCGTLIAGPIGATMAGYGMYLMRKAQKLGQAIRPWSVTIIGGFVFIDASMNSLCWATDLLCPDTWIAKNIWIHYGMLLDGGYAMFYNSQGIGSPGLLGVAAPGEKGIEVAGVFLLFPMRAMAAWGFMRMKRWGLQWLIVACWMYVFLWVFYGTNMSVNFDLRFGFSDFGVLGFWLIAGIPFIGPMILLPYLHTVNRELWK